MLTIGTLPLRALCRLARPLPSPGPRCNRVAPGLSAMRAYPSAAPVAAPSNSARIARISGTESSAATKCISEVPGFVKHVVTSASTSVRIRVWAPFGMSLSLRACVVHVSPERLQTFLSGVAQVRQPECVLEAAQQRVVVVLVGVHAAGLDELREQHGSRVAAAGPWHACHVTARVR